MNKQSIKSFGILLLMFMLSFGLLAGCGNNESDEIEDENLATSEQQAKSEKQAMNEGQTFTAQLNAASEVHDVTSDASGTVTVTLHGDSIHVQGQFSGLSSEYAGSHIHQGVEGENGGPIQPLNPTLGNDKMSGSWDASYKWDQSQISALKADSLYINVHSTKYQQGEIRGQLTSSGSEM